jgi:hypothetical protein
MILDNQQLKISGHVTITDKLTNEILLDTHNSIHFENLSVAIVESLMSGVLNASDTTTTGFVYSMAFGNGGTTVSSTGIITYNPPNNVGSTASLYNKTYDKIINNNFSANSDTIDNNITYDHIPGKAYTDMVISCLLDYGEPSNQTAFDNVNSIKSNYAFDELGLISSSGQLLTHVTFSPIIKSSNRQLDITYVVRISTLSSLSA